MKQISIPNILTLLRFVMAPVFILACLHASPHSCWPTVIFLLASVTDWLDGCIARHYGLSSRIGAFMDPVADKTLVVSALLMLLYIEHSVALLMCTIIIILREFLVTALRAWMVSIGQQQAVKVQWIGRIKSFTQMAGISICLLSHAMQHHGLYEIGLFTLVIAVMLSLISMMVYIQASWKHLQFLDPI